MNTEGLAALVAGGGTLAVAYKSERRGSRSDRELVETVAGRGPAIRCWPTRSNAPASWSAPGGA